MRSVLLASLVLVLGCAGDLASQRADDLFVRGYLEHARDDLAAAEASYRASLQAVPTSPAANNLGVLAARRGDLGGARRWFDYAARLNAADLTPRINLGVVLYHQGRTGSAADELMGARRQRRAVLDSILPIGRVNWDADRYASATARADQVAGRYLDRLMSTTAEPPEGEELYLARSLVVAR